MLHTSSDSRAASADSRSAALSAVNNWCRLTAPSIDELIALPSEFDAAGDIADVAAAVRFSTSAAASDESVEIAAATELVNSTGDVPMAIAVD